MHSAVLRFCVVCAAITIFEATSPAVSAAAQLAIAWTDNSSDEDGFLIERRGESAGPFTQIMTLGANAVAFIDSTATAGLRYCYRVRAFNAVGASAYTNEACGAASAASSAGTLAVSLAKSEFLSTETMVATVTATAGSSPTQVDAYVVIQDPIGGVWSLTVDGRLVQGLVPMASNIALPNGSVSFGLPLAPAPPGTYTWLAAATAAGTLTLVSPLVSTPFTVVR